MRADGDVKDANGVEFKFGDYDQEHYALVEAIRNNLPYNEGHFGATSSFTSVLGRMATYSGKIVKWDEAVGEGPLRGTRHRRLHLGYDSAGRAWRRRQLPRRRPGIYNPFA